MNYILFRQTLPPPVRKLALSHGEEYVVVMRGKRAWK